MSDGMQILIYEIISSTCRELEEPEGLEGHDGVLVVLHSQGGLLHHHLQTTEIQVAIVFS